MADFLITELDDRFEVGVPFTLEDNMLCLNSSVCWYPSGEPTFRS